MRENERLQRARAELLGQLRAEEHRLATLLHAGVTEYNARNNAMGDLMDKNREIKAELDALSAYANKLALTLRPDQAATTNGETS